MYKGFLIELILNDDNSTKIELIPYVHNSFNKDEIGIRKMNTEESEFFLNNIFEISKKIIDNPHYVNDEWIKLSKSLENTYLSVLNGNGRIMRKLNE